MRDTGNSTRQDQGPSYGHIDLAMDAIQHAIARRQSGVETLKTVLLHRMMEMAESADPACVDVMLEEFRRARITEAEIADHFIPTTAIALGQAWLDDRASFARVTIGTARLQTLLHRIQADWMADVADPQGDGAVLVLVPPGEQHTLGSLVLASSLRRLGISVCIRIGPGLTELSQLVANHRFDAAMVSVGSADKVEISLKLVKTLKQMTKSALRVAVGGAVTEECRATLQQSGADMVSNDVKAVIAAFGLGKPALAVGNR